MDKHLAVSHTADYRRSLLDDLNKAIAPKYFSTLFIRVCVDNVPWLVTKLGIQVLPCVLCFIDGVSRDR
jgi:thioredoxin-like negative regulator of GroEL